jgi:hypothetical protein
MGTAVSSFHRGWPRYASEFHDGLVEISVSDGKYADKTGELVLDPGLYRGWDFSEGLAVAMRKREELWGYIDTTGQFAISPRFETYPNGYVYPFSDGMAKIEAKGLFGFIDHSGVFAIPPQLLDAESFSDGMARVVVEGPCVYFPEGGCGGFNPVFPGVQNKKPLNKAYPSCKFTYINKSGKIITGQRFDGARSFSEGLAPVRIGDLWGFIDRAGSIVIPPQFADAEPFSSGLSRILKDGKYGYIDKSGLIQISPQFAEAQRFSDDLAVVGDKTGKSWYINLRGERAFAGDFEEASPFFKGLANVRLPSTVRERFAYIDKTGRIVFRY